MLGRTGESIMDVLPVILIIFGLILLISGWWFMAGVVTSLGLVMLYERFKWNS
jgi:hypothetical protein